MHLSEKKINQILALVDIGYKERMQAIAQAQAQAFVPTAENLRANFATQINIRPSADASLEYYIDYNSMGNRERKHRRAQAREDAFAAFKSPEFSERMQPEPVANPVPERTPQETKIERKLRKQNIDIHDVMATPEQIAEEERQIAQSVQENATGLPQEPYESSATKKAQKRAQEQASSAEHSAQRVRPNKAERNARYVTSQGQMTHEARAAYNETEAALLRAGSQPVRAYEYPESGVNWRELYADAIETPAAPHRRRRHRSPHSSGYYYYGSFSGATSGTTAAASEASTAVTSSATSASSGISSAANSAANGAEDAINNGANDAAGAAKKNKKLWWIVGGIAVAAALITGYIAKTKRNQKTVQQNQAQAA